MPDMTFIEDMTSGEMIAYLGTDAAKWAAAFVHFNPATGMADTPGDTLHGWFCNAIEAGRSAGVERLREALEHAGDRAREARKRENAARQEADRLRKERDQAIGYLAHIAGMPTTETNPDGVDQAAWSMQLVAQEAVSALQQQRTSEEGTR